jgi:hypothetical protein
MAARIRKHHQDEVRARIQVGQLVKVLENQALGTAENEITPMRIKAIEILLRKSLPDLSAIELTGAEGGPLRIVASAPDEKI